MDVTDNDTEDFDLEYECTCGIKSGDDNHYGNCELWLCMGWQEGLLTWHHGELLDAEDVYGWGAEAVTEVELVKPTVSQDDDTYECTCFNRDDTSITHATKHSATCGVQEHEAWARSECEWDHPTRTFVYYPAEKKTSSFSGGWGGYGGADAWASYKTCTHDGTVALEFPSGVKIYPASSYDTKARASVPDHALYLETSRLPVSAATYIPWKDYGLPTINHHHAAQIICETYYLAASGLTVEIGCIGAHGRTGTALACMAILSGVPVDEAVEWVREHHCKSAVEGEMQRWWVQWFGAWLTGTPAPPTPPPPAPFVEPKKHTGAPQSTSLPFDSVPVPVPAKKTGASCPECAASLGDYPLNGYMCWNTLCSFYNVAAFSPAAKKNGLFGKGRKKHK